MGGEVFLGAAAVFASFVSSACFARVFADRRERERAYRNAKRSEHAQSGDCDERLDDRLISYAESLSRMISLGILKPVAKGGSFAPRWFSAHAKKAGIEELVTQEGFAKAQLRAAIIGLAIGALAGVALSVELAALLALTGACVGFLSLPWAVRQRERRRAEELERRLSEMLEVVALGLRSGLSFDRGLQLYADHFDSLLARSCASAERQWTLGLKTREEALRNLSDSYASPLFERVVDGIVRSLHFGSSLAESLESAASEARIAYRTRKQEQVAKAPVKMMIPTGTLMLPAMLILVMGPVMLELMGGF